MQATGQRRTTPLIVSWSGGKDAAWALHTLWRDASYEPVALLTTVTAEYERIAMHGIRRDVLLAQAQATGLPLFEARQPRHCDNAAYERAFVEALGQARERLPGLRHIAFGDLFLEDVRAWRRALCERHGWTAVFPLFGRNTATVAGEMLAGGLRATLCCVDTTQLDAAFSGRRFDADLLDSLPPTVDPCGENGEFHTCVDAGPMFRHPLALQRTATVLRDGRFAYTDFALRASGATGE